MENLLAQLDEVKSDKLRQSLRESAAAVLRNQKLVRLPEVPCEFVPENLVVRAGDEVVLRRLYAGWGFKGMLAALGAPGEKQAELI